jgi:hypothetical protein
MGVDSYGRTVERDPWVPDPEHLGPVPADGEGCEGPQSVLVLDPLGHVTGANPGAIFRFGLRLDWRHDPLRDVRARDGSVRVDRIELGGSLDGLGCLLPDGTPARLSLTALLDGAGQLSGWVVWAHDLEQR